MSTKPKWWIQKSQVNRSWWLMHYAEFFENFDTKKQAQKALDTMQPVVIGHCPNCGHALYKGHI
jgi:hypothetical protein